MAAQIFESLLEESHLTQIRLWHEWEINFYVKPWRLGVYALPQQSLACADTWADGKVPKERENLLIQNTESQLWNECPSTDLREDRVCWPSGQTQLCKAHPYLEMMESGWTVSEVLSCAIGVWTYAIPWTSLGPCRRERRNPASQKERWDVWIERWGKCMEIAGKLVRKGENLTTSEEEQAHFSYLCEYSLTFQKWSYRRSQKMTVQEL